MAGYCGGGWYPPKKTPGLISSYATDEMLYELISASFWPLAANGIVITASVESDQNLVIASL